MKKLHSEVDGWKELTEEYAKENCELNYMESPLGFHFAVDFTWIDQRDDFKLTLPTGEIFDSSKHIPE